MRFVVSSSISGGMSYWCVPVSTVAWRSSLRRSTSFGAVTPLVRYMCFDMAKAAITTVRWARIASWIWWKIGRACKSVFAIRKAFSMW